MGPLGTTPAPGSASTPAPLAGSSSSPKSPSDVFAAAVTGGLKSTTKSNAPLDPNTIISLATGIVAPKPTVKTVSVSARATYFLVQYAVEGAAAGPVLVEIGHYTEAAAAQDVLRQYLTTFDADVATVTKKTSKPLGQVSLQTGASVFWVRDAIWVRVQASSTIVPDPSSTTKIPPQQTPPKSSTTHEPTATTPSGTSAPPAPAAPSNPVLEKLLLPFAGALDAHLLKFAVAPTAQLKPNTAVKTASYKGPRGKEFSFQLVDAKGAHALKPAEPVVADGSDAGKIVAPLRNGSVAGEYTFLGCQAGKGKVYLIVTREDTLAVGTAEVNVEII